MACDGSRKKARWLTKCNLKHGICPVCNRMIRCEDDGKVKEHAV